MHDTQTHTHRLSRSSCMSLGIPRDRRLCSKDVTVKRRGTGVRSRRPSGPVLAAQGHGAQDVGDHLGDPMPAKPGHQAQHSPILSASQPSRPPGRPVSPTVLGQPHTGLKGSWELPPWALPSVGGGGFLLSSPHQLSVTSVISELRGEPAHTTAHEVQRDPQPRAPQVCRIVTLTPSLREALSDSLPLGV